MRAQAHTNTTRTVIISLIVVALVAAGIFWWYNRQKEPQQHANLDPNTATHLSEGLRAIEAQDSAFADVKEVKLVIDPSVESAYSIVRPYEQLSEDDQAASKQTLANGSLTTLEGFGIAKKMGEGEDARSLYNSGYYIYKLEGQNLGSSTEAVVKAKIEAEIASFNQGESNPTSPYIYVNGPAQLIGEITLSTKQGETVKLPVSKYEQTIKSKANPSTQKTIVRVMAAAKLGERLVFVNMAIDEQAEFDKAATNLQAMASYVTLDVTR